MQQVSMRRKELLECNGSPVHRPVVNAARDAGALANVDGDVGTHRWSCRDGHPDDDTYHDVFRGRMLPV